jgi:hypothetical protein
MCTAFANIKQNFRISRNGLIAELNLQFSKIIGSVSQSIIKQKI